MIQNLAEKLVEERRKSGLSQKRVAELTGLSKASVSKYENGGVPPADALMKLAAQYRVSVDYLLGMDKRRRIDVEGLDQREITSIKQLVSILLEAKL